MGFVYTGKCRCESTRVRVELPNAIAEYAPRKCDCDFCARYDGCYLSDPNGRLQVQASAALEVRWQGDRLAGMYHCAQCDDLISASLQLPDGLIGNVRAPLLDDAAELQAPVMISPQTLSADEKYKRWRSLWMPVQLE